MFRTWDSLKIYTTVLLYYLGGLSYDRLGYTIVVILERETIRKSMTLNETNRETAVNFSRKFEYLNIFSAPNRIKGQLSTIFR